MRVTSGLHALAFLMALKLVTLAHCDAAQSGIHAINKALPLTQSSADHHKQRLMFNSFALSKSRFYLLQIHQTEGHKSS
jgi:hypothetical protein